jgi:hypothetical protein
MYRRCRTLARCAVTTRLRHGEMSNAFLSFCSSQLRTRTPFSYLASGPRSPQICGLYNCCFGGLPSRLFTRTRGRVRSGGLANPTDHIHVRLPMQRFIDAARHGFTSHGVRGTPPKPAHHLRAALQRRRSRIDGNPIARVRTGTSSSDAWEGDDISPLAVCLGTKGTRSKKPRTVHIHTHHAHNKFRHRRPHRSIVEPRPTRWDLAPSTLTPPNRIRFGKAGS